MATNHSTQAAMANKESLLNVMGFVLKEDTYEFVNKNNEIIVLDVETTGLKSESDKIVQFSGIKFKAEDGKLHEIARLDQFIFQPEYDENKPIKNGETFGTLTGITNEFLKTQPNEEEAFKIIYDFLGDAPIIAAYNTPFDYGFISQMYIRNGKNFLTTAENRMDVLIMARDLVSKEDAPKVPNDKGELVPSHRLSAIAGLYGLDTDESGSGEKIAFHNSMNDVIATARLLEVFVYEYAQLILEASKEEEKTKYRARLKSITYWAGYRGFSRIYVNAFLNGEFVSYFYDIRGKKWGEKTDGTIDSTDMTLFFQDVYDLAKVSNEDELAKIKEEIVADSEFNKRYENK